MLIFLACGTLIIVSLAFLPAAINGFREAKLGELVLVVIQKMRRTFSIMARIGLWIAFIIFVNTSSLWLPLCYDALSFCYAPSIAVLKWYFELIGLDQLIK